MIDRQGTPILYGVSKEGEEELWCRLSFNIDELPISSAQRERMIFLLGPRYKGKPTVRIVSKQYPTYEQNTKRCIELFKELTFESLRAPNKDLASVRNPYRHARQKRRLGRTKEERDFKKALQKEEEK